jgi:hypothetical protein
VAINSHQAVCAPKAHLILFLPKNLITVLTKFAVRIFVL